MSLPPQEPRRVQPPPPKPRYRLFVDESGDHAYAKLDDPAHRYLALLGVWFRQTDDYVLFSDRMAAFKRDFFGPEVGPFVVLHRSDIIGRKGAFGRLKDQTVLARFNAGLLELISEAKFRMTCVVIDKLRHSNKYSSPFHPYHYCLAALLDRYSGWLGYKNSVGDVMAESRGKEENRQLQDAYLRVYNSGTLMFNREHHQRALTSTKIKMKDKKGNDPGLQLADMLAYPMKQDMLVERGEIADPGQVFGKQVVAAATPKFNRNEYRGQVSGYGKVWLT